MFVEKRNPLSSSTELSTAPPPPPPSYGAPPELPPAYGAPPPPVQQYQYNNNPNPPEGQPQYNNPNPYQQYAPQPPQQQQQYLPNQSDQYNTAQQQQQQQQLYPNTTQPQYNPNTTQQVVTAVPINAAPPQGPAEPLIMKPKMDQRMIFMLVVGLLCICGMFVGEYFAIANKSNENSETDDDGDDTVALLMIVYMAVIVVAVTVVLFVKWPRALELSQTCVVYRTRCVSHSVAYERLAAVEYVANVCCYCNAMCVAPKGMWTSFSDGFFLRSDDCGQSILFSPDDPQEFARMLRATPLANRLRDCPY